MAGIHLATPGLAPPPKPWSPAEQAHFAGVDAWTGEEGGYAHVHSAKPATLGAALHDSPAGLAAWIGEKITAWRCATPSGRYGHKRAPHRLGLSLPGRRHPQRFVIGSGLAEARIAADMLHPG